MRRPSSPTFGLNVPHRVGAGRLPQSRKGGALVGAGWRAHRAPASASSGSRVATVALWVFFTLIVGAAIVAAVINPKWIRHPPEWVLYGLLQLILAMGAMWAVYFTASTVREGLARRERARARSEKKRAASTSSASIAEELP